MGREERSKRGTTMPANLFGREPVLYLALVQAALALDVGFGLGLTGEQVAGLMAFAAAVLGVVTRSRVSPVETAPSAPALAG